MSTIIFKKFAAPLLAIALVAVMGVSLLTNARTAHASAITGTFGLGASKSTTTVIPMWSAGTTLSTITLVSTDVTSIATGETITYVAPTGATWTASTCTVIVTATGIADTGQTCVGFASSNTYIVTFTGTQAAAASRTITIGGPTLKIPTTNTAGTILRGGTAVATGTIPAVDAVIGTFAASSDFKLGWNTSTTAPAGFPLTGLTGATATADANGAGGAICAFSATAGVVNVGLPVTFTVSLGVVSTGTAKTVLAVTGTTGSVCTNYRGTGGVAATDTAIVSNSLSNVVDTLSIALTAPTGGTAAKLSIQQPASLAVSPTISNATPGYMSGTTRTNFAVQALDAAGLGVNGQVLLMTVDKGGLVAGHSGTCPSTVHALTGTTASASLTENAAATAGTIALTYCGNSGDATGTATITVQNISTAMANVNTTISTANRPNKVVATYKDGVISASVTDSNGNKVADGTPVQFTISSTAGAVSNACTLSSNGTATSAVALVAASGSVIVTANWNETSSAATCAAPGSQNTSATVNIGAVVTPPNTAPVGTGAGGFASAPVFSAGANKQAAAVFNGGTIPQLEAAVSAAKGSGVWAQDPKGNFVLDVVGGPAFVNIGFVTAFPTGFTGITAVTIVAQ